MIRYGIVLRLLYTCYEIKPEINQSINQSIKSLDGLKNDDLVVFAVRRCKIKPAIIQSIKSLENLKNHDLEVLVVHPRYQVFLIVAHALAPRLQVLPVGPSIHRVEGELESLVDGHGGQVALGLRGGGGIGMDQRVPCVSCC